MAWPVFTCKYIVSIDRSFSVRLYIYFHKMSSALENIVRKSCNGISVQNKFLVNSAKIEQSPYTKLRRMK